MQSISPVDGLVWLRSFALLPLDKLFPWLAFGEFCSSEVSRSVFLMMYRGSFSFDVSHLCGSKLLLPLSFSSWSAALRLVAGEVFALSGGASVRGVFMLLRGWSLELAALVLQGLSSSIWSAAFLLVWVLSVVLLISMAACSSQSPSVASSFLPDFWSRVIFGSGMWGSTSSSLPRLGWCLDCAGHCSAAARDP